MTNSSMILLSLGMILLFLGPFVIIGAIKDRKEARRKKKESKYTNQEGVTEFRHTLLFYRP